jgi:tripartite-type tricarboxylate transporter receptor subunit TctC
VQSRELKARYLDLGVEAVPTGPVEFAKVLTRESDKWKKVIKDFKVVAQ